MTGQSTYVCPDIPAKSIKALDDAVLAAAAGETEASIKTIKQLIAKYPTWTLARQQLSRVQYRADMKNEAVETMEASIAIDTASQLSQLYSLGRMYEETNEPPKAVNAYKVVIRRSKDSDLSKRATASLKSLEEKSDLWKANEEITFTPLPSEINTPNHEYLGRWTLDGKELIFTRRFNQQEDLFIAKFDSNGNIKVEDVSFNSNLNEAAHAISPDGKYLVFTSCSRPDGIGDCDLYISVRKNDTWSKPKNMGALINTPGWESQPCFGIDGMSIYFASNRPGGYGGNDIWMVKQLPGGDWSQPVNVGPPINTANNEASPFIYFDGRTIYFMKDGKGGLGGYDLYISHLGLDGKWLAPENMKAPINSGTDEGALSLHPDGRTAVITRMTPGQLNDLFEFQLPEKFLSTPVQALQVRVIDHDTKKPIRARLEVFEVAGLDTIRASQWSDETGNISTTLEKNKPYGLIGSSDGYLMYSMNVEPDTSSIRKFEIEMTPIATAADKTIVLHNVFFSTGSSELLPSSDPELKILYRTLVDHPDMKIEIRGHTDNVGDDAYNQQLSEARAKSVFQYLVDRGIDTGRLSYKGFGETQPIASNDTEQGRKQNRRTEFFVVSSE